MFSHRTPRGFASILLSLIVGMLVAAGCGSDGRLSKSEYIERMNTLQTEAASAISSSTGASASAKDAAAIGSKLDAVIKDLSGLKPPTEWQKHHDAIVESLETTRDATQAVSKAKPGDVKLATAQLKKITSAQAQYSKAIEAINNDR